MMADNVNLTVKHLSPDLYCFLEVLACTTGTKVLLTGTKVPILTPKEQATILLQTSPHEAFHKFDGLAQKHVEVACADVC
jgi:hypothetical protein